ncbi:MAG: hypothetical protein WA728_37385 [Xanthobacteraceae bacterium]
MVRRFPGDGGVTSEDLRKAFEKQTGLARQSFYNALAHAKREKWLVVRDRFYSLNSDGSWREPTASIGEQLEKAQLEKDRLEYLAGSQDQQVGELLGELERLRDWTGSEANGEANVALSSLLRIVGSTNASMRQRLKASAAILGYETHDDGVTEFVKKFLGSVCADVDTAVDYRVEAAELLRRHEAPRVTPENVRPAYRNDDVPAEPPPVPLMELVRQRRERQYRLERERQDRLERERGPKLSEKG